MPARVLWNEAKFESILERSFGKRKNIYFDRSMTFEIIDRGLAEES
jgi:hypothetical protein